MIHILDGQEGTILDYVTLDNIISDNHKRSLEKTLETYDFIAFADKRNSEFLEKRNRIIIPDEDGSLVEFVIFEAAKYKDTEGHKAQVFAHASYLELKKASILYPDSGFTGTASQHGGRALNNTVWQMGIVESKGTRTLTISSHTNPYEMLKRIAKEFELELNFRVTHDGNKITGRYVDLLERVGEWRGREVEFGKDLDSIRRVEKQDIVTALLGLGPEREDGTRLEVLVTDDDALKRWGSINEHGELQHLIEPYEIQSERSEMTETEARQYTRTALNKRINTQITYETTIIDLEEVPGMENKKIRFGDTIKIKDIKFNPPLYLEARVFEQNRSIKSKAKKDIKLGDFIEHTEEEVNAIWKQLQKEIRNRVSFYEMAEYTYDKLTIDDKDEQVYEDGKTFAEATGITAEENAKDYADEQDAKIKSDVQDYADDVSGQKANSALDAAKQYAVAKEVYENQMDKIADDIEDRAPLEYVDGEFIVIKDDLNKFDNEIEKKADGSTVYTISEVDNMINNTVSLTEYETDMQGIVTDLESHGTRIGQNENAIGLKADSSEVDAVENSLETKIGNVEVKADSVITSVSEVRADLDGLEIGGRNLLLDSKVQEVPTTTSYITLPFSKMIPKGETITLSVGDIEIVHNESSPPRFRFAFRDDGAGTGTLVGIVYLSEDEKVVTFEARDDVYKVLIYGWQTTGTSGNHVIFHNIQVEKGNKATDWSPAPEDTDEAISDVSGRVETLDGEITTVAGEVKLKASQSVVDSLENRVSTAEGELRVLPEMIEGKVDDGQARSIFTQEASQFTFDANQVNFTGHVFGKGAEFEGKLKAASGTFRKVTQDDGDRKIELDEKGLDVFSKDASSGVSIIGSVPYGEETEYTGSSIAFYSQKNNGKKDYHSSIYEDGPGLVIETGVLGISQKGVDSSSIPVLGVHGSANVNGQLIVNSRSVSGGLALKSISGTSHYLAGHNTNGNLIIYPVRVSGEDRFRIRSHAGKSDYENDFRITTSGYLTIPNAGGRTSTNAANVRLANASGNFLRVTSSKKYKLCIDDVKSDPYAILGVLPKDWYDKANSEGFCDYLSGKSDPDREGIESFDNIRRIPGLIAEEVEEAGLEQFVDYDDETGEIEGVMYDRLWTLLIPIVKEHEIKITNLDEQVMLQDEKLLNLEERTTDNEKRITKIENLLEVA